MDHVLLSQIAHPWSLKSVVSRENEPMKTKFKKDSSHLIGCLVKSHFFSDYGCANHDTMDNVMTRYDNGSCDVIMDDYGSCDHLSKQSDMEG